MRFGDAETDLPGVHLPTRGGKINVTIESTYTLLFEWMVNRLRERKPIVFVKRDSDATLKEIKFTEGYLVNYFDNSEVPVIILLPKLLPSAPKNWRKVTASIKMNGLNRSANLSVAIIKT